MLSRSRSLQAKWNQAGPNKNMVFTYDESSVEHVQPKALFVPHMIYEQKGTCSTMPTLWYIIADRLGWPVNVVRGPGHLWVRYKGEKQGNIEATANGGFIPDSQYIKDMQISKEAIRKGVYMKPLTKKEFLATLMVNNAFYNVLSVEDLLQVLFEVRYEESKKTVKEFIKELIKAGGKALEKFKGIPISEKLFNILFGSPKKVDDVFRYLEILCKHIGCNLIILNQTETDKQDLIQDFISVITSFCARIYGQRRGKRKTEQLIKELENDKKINHKS